MHPDLLALMENSERRVTLDLEDARAAYSNSTERGNAMERAIADALRRHLPVRLGTARGEVIDSHGRRSRQVDVVIADETHPFTFEERGQGLFFIEGVVAACEVKSSLRVADLDVEVEKAMAFKALRPQVPGGFMTTLPMPNLVRYYERRPYAIVAAESDSSLRALRDALEERQRSLGAGHADFLDGVFVVGSGALVNLGDGDETFCVSTAASARLRGWVGWSGKPALASALGWLYCIMPNQDGRTPPMTSYFMPQGAGRPPDDPQRRNVIHVIHGAQGAPHDASTSTTIG